MSTNTELQKLKTKKRSPKLLDQVRLALRLRHYSYKTDKSYIGWIKRYIYFHNKSHPKVLASEHIVQFLNFLASKMNVSAETQNQALCALIFLYEQVLKVDPGQLEPSFRQIVTESQK